LLSSFNFQGQNLAQNKNESILDANITNIIQKENKKIQSGFGSHLNPPGVGNSKFNQSPPQDKPDYKTENE
jgi:hypothetical protein